MAASIVGNQSTDEICTSHVNAWLLSCLRFAVTRDDADRAAFLTRARELDRGGNLGNIGFSFFSRVSNELCDAILAPNSPQARNRLRTFLNSINDARLRRTLEAAVGLEEPRAKSASSAPNRSYLWRGLAPRVARRS
jgi:hypothetical protein